MKPEKAVRVLLNVWKYEYQDTKTKQWFTAGSNATHAQKKASEHSIATNHHVILWGESPMGFRCLTHSFGKKK